MGAKVQFSIRSERYSDTDVDVCLGHLLDLRDRARIGGVGVEFDARTTDTAEGSVDCRVCDVQAERRDGRAGYTEVLEDVGRYGS